jgi:hypothetical protein
MGSQKPTLSGCWGSGSSFWAVLAGPAAGSGCDWPTKIHKKGDDMYLSSTDAEKVQCTTVLVGCHFSIFLGYIHSCIHESQKVFSLGWPRFDILTLFPTPRLVLYLLCLQFWHILTYLSFLSGGPILFVPNSRVKTESSFTQRLVFPTVRVQ